MESEILLQQGIYVLVDENTVEIFFLPQDSFMHKS